LAKARDRVIGAYCLRGGEEDHSCRQTYRLEPLARPAPAAAAADGMFELSG
jgi:hypothetical protein